MDNDTRQPHDRQDDNARKILYGVVLLVALALVWSRFAPAPPQQPFYWPDPTPIVVQTQHTEINIFSKNCVGYCP
jgi:hypothetical protein